MVGLTSLDLETTMQCAQARPAREQAIIKILEFVGLATKVRKPRHVRHAERAAASA